MKSILLIVVLLAALVTIASGLWVAKALFTAISQKGRDSGAKGR